MAVETASWIGALLAGRYEVTRKLGEGGMGFVYRARDRNLDSDVVIKVPRAAMLEDADFAGRFTREVRSLVKLAHPAIVKVTDVGEHDGTPYAVLQYLPGGSLRDRQPTDASGKPCRMPAGALRGWLPAVAEALDFMHRQRYIHRDVKPDNILFDPHGHAFISDFGIAKVLAEETSVKPRTVHTRSGLVLGTPQYMAPEMILGDKYNGSVDQYALAVTVYEMISGCYPFDGANPTAIFMQQTTGEPPALAGLRPDLPAELCQAVHKALAKEPGKRFADCSSFAQSVLAGLQDAAGTETAPITDGKTAAAEVVAMPCPRCGKLVKVPPETRGKRVRCPGCRGIFDVPIPTTTAAVVAPGSGRDVPILPSVTARTPTPQGELRLTGVSASSRPPFPWKAAAGVGGTALVSCAGVLAVLVALSRERDADTGTAAADPPALPAQVIGQQPATPPDPETPATRPQTSDKAEARESSPPKPQLPKAKAPRPNPIKAKPAPKQSPMDTAVTVPPRKDPEPQRVEDAPAKPRHGTVVTEQRPPQKYEPPAWVLAKAEADAKVKLKMARNYADDATMEFAKGNYSKAGDNKKKASERLKAIVKDHPTTESAKEAKKLLERMEQIRE